MAWYNLGGKFKKEVSKKIMGSQVGKLGTKMKKRLEIPSFKKGGKIKKNMVAYLHKGERVLNKKQTKKYAKNKS